MGEIRSKTREGVGSRKLRVVGPQHLNGGELLERVRAFYDNGLWEIRDALGKMPRCRWHLGCILLKMPAVSFRQGGASKTPAMRRRPMLGR